MITTMAPKIVTMPEPPLSLPRSLALGGESVMSVSSSAIASAGAGAAGFDGSCEEWCEARGRAEGIVKLTVWSLIPIGCPAASARSCSVGTAGRLPAA
jgi:hypothetical protein